MVISIFRQVKKIKNGSREAAEEKPTSCQILKNILWVSILVPRHLSIRD